MINTIVQKIYDKLIAAGLNIGNIDFNEMVDRKTGSLQRPVVNISVNSGRFNKLPSQICYENELTVSLYLMTQNLRGEKESRANSYELIHAITQALLFDNLDGTLQKKLIPVVYNNVTDDVFAKAGYQIYKLDFICSYNIDKKTDEEDYGNLKAIINKYYIPESINVDNGNWSD